MADKTQRCYTHIATISAVSFGLLRMPAVDEDPAAPAPLARAVRIVLDTNVLLSAILFGGTPGQILDAWRAGQVELVMSPDIVDEYVRVGERLNGRCTDVDIQPIVALVVQNATIVPSTPLPGAVCDDPQTKIKVAHKEQSLPNEMRATMHNVFDACFDLVTTMLNVFSADIPTK